MSSVHRRVSSYLSQQVFHSNEKFRCSASIGTLRQYPAAICCGKVRVTSRSYSLFVELTGVPFIQARLNCVPSFSSLPVCMIIAKSTSLVPECSASPDIRAWCNAAAALVAQVSINCFKVCHSVQAFGLFQAWDTVTSAYQSISTCRLHAKAHWASIVRRGNSKRSGYTTGSPLSTRSSPPATPICRDANLSA